MVSRQHLVNALFNTIITTLPSDASSSTPNTRTHNLHSEILLGLSINTNITDAIRRHGIADDSKRVIIIRIGGQQTGEEVWEGMKSLVEGDVGSIAELDEGKDVDWPRVDKVSSDSLCDSRSSTLTLCVPLTPVAGVQDGRDESTQRPGSAATQNRSYRISDCHQVSHIDNLATPHRQENITSYPAHLYPVPK